MKGKHWNFKILANILYVLVHVSGAQNNKRQLQIVEKKKSTYRQPPFTICKKTSKKSEEKDLELSSTPHILVMMFFFQFST